MKRPCSLAICCRPLAHHLLDPLEAQAQDVVAAFGSVMAAPDIRSRKLAFLCGSTLARLQAQRLTDREGVAFFDDAAAAEAWLLA